MRGRLGVALLAGLTSCGPGDGPDPAAERTEQVASLARSLEEARAEQARLSAALEEALARVAALGEQASGAADLEAAMTAQREEIAQLRSELARKDARLLEREQEFMAFAELAALAGTSDPSFELLARLAPDAAVRIASGPEVDPDHAEPDPQRERAERMAPALQGLLLAEGVRGWQVVTLGRLADGAVGPVVLRLLDERGRPAGLVAAERLRLEASRAARTVTLVLEEGREERDGVSLPFEGALSVEASGAHLRGGVRRVEVTGVAVEPWLETLPELFRPEDLEPAVDDGAWDLVAVRQELNRLLARQEGAGSWRLAGLGGVVDTTLHDVQVVELDDGGRPGRRLFADRLVLETNPAGGLRLQLTDGVQHRGAEQTPFLEGRFTIVLPRADADAWRAVGLPGLEASRSPLRRGDPPAAPAEPGILPDRG